MDGLMDLSFYKNRRVFVTGHTGFKGSWLCALLTFLGADVTGYSLKPPTDPSLFEMSGLEGKMKSIIGDVRDFGQLYESFQETRPEVVFHLAAQPLVRESYRDPHGTYETNVMGTVNLLECVRLEAAADRGPISVLNVTTDKVYKNFEREQGYREDEILDGFDPYSNSKSCSELVTHSYINSFFQGMDAPAVSTARAGNVIGGGDFAKDRIIPDCIRAATGDEKIIVRNPYSIRPFQHVLEPLYVYLMIAEMQAADRKYAGFYNVGPDEEDCITTGELVELFCRCWGEGASWEHRGEKGAVHEAGFLKLDCTRLKDTFAWRPKWHIEKAVEETCRFSHVMLAGGDVAEEMVREIREYLDD